MSAAPFRLRCALFALILLLALGPLVGCARPTDPDAAEIPLLTDADLDAAPALEATRASGSALGGSFDLAAALAAGARVDRRSAGSLRALPRPAATAADDEPGHLVYIEELDLLVDSLWRLRLSRALDEGPGRLIYRGRRVIESSAVSVDGELVTFTAATRRGDLDVFLLDRGGAFGRADRVYRLPGNPAHPDGDSPADESDVSMSLDGAVHAWQSVDPESGARNYVVALLDRSSGGLELLAFSIALDDTPIDVIDPSLSGDGGLVVWATEDEAVLAEFGAPQVVAFSLEGDAVFGFGGVPGLTESFADPSTNLDGTLLMVSEVFDGVPYLNVFDPRAFELGFPLVGLPFTHPYLTADGRRYAFEMTGAIYVLEVAPGSSASDLAQLVIPPVQITAGSAPFWAEGVPPPPPPPEGVIVYSGTNDTGDTFFRPEGTGPELVGPVGYDAFAFTAERDGVHDFVSEQDYDGYLHLYAAPFDPDAPLENVLAANDDLDFIGRSGFRELLEAGTEYVLVTSSFAPIGEFDSLGTFTNTITPPQPADPDAAPRIELFAADPLATRPGAEVGIEWLVASAGAVDCTVDWGDGAIDVIDDCAPDLLQRAGHVYANEGFYTIAFTAVNGNGEATELAFPTIAADDEDAFDIVVVFTNDLLSTSQRAAFQSAADRWAEVIAGDLRPQASGDGVIPTDYSCFGEPDFNGFIDDVVISASGEAIDGPGGILAAAGPCLFREGGSNGDLAALPAYGIMLFDLADLAALEAEGALVSTILHEMGHVLGIGTLWEENDLLDYEPPGADCNFDDLASPLLFVGDGAVGQYAALGGSGGVPVEDEFGPGTRCGHWDEAVFDDELMTGFLNSGVDEPLSIVTVGSLADLGYAVDLAAADPYTLPSGGALRSQGVVGRDLVLDRIGQNKR